MPIGVQWEECGVVLEISGEIVLDDFRDVIMRIMSDSRYDDIRYVICDLRGREPIEDARFREENSVLAAFMKGLYQDKDFVLADVVSDPRMLAVSEQYAELAMHPFSVFTNIADARNWIKKFLEK